MRFARFLAIAAVAILAWHGLAYGKSKQLATEHFLIEYKDINDETVVAAARDAERALTDVTSFLGKDRAGWKIRLRIGKEYPEPRSLPDGRIMEIPADRLGPGGARGGPQSIRGRGPTFWHGVANVVAPGGHAAGNWGRFLKEGLGGYLQAKFGGTMPTPWPAKVYPAMGEDLHRATSRLAGEIGLLSLEDAKRHVNERKLTRTRQLAWLQAASFVGHLVETRPVERFNRWYEGLSFEEAYGVELEIIEKEWARFIEGLKS